ncbi:MAG: FHA domain-containing protein [Pirellulaceae bacterium]
MQLILKVIGGPSTGMKLLLRQGEIAKVGRTEWADFCLPHDELLGEFHFAMQVNQNQCLLWDLDSGQPTMVNGQPVMTAYVNHGDLISAGTSEFAVELTGSTIAPSENDNRKTAVFEPVGQPESSTAPDASSQDTGPQSLTEWCTALEISKEAMPVVTDESDPWDLVDAWQEQELFADCLRLAACLLAPIHAVRWGIDCVSSTQLELSDGGKQAMEAASKWAEKPDEANRRACEKIAEASEYDGAAAWVALAAFWSQGSMAPQGQPEVPPPPGLFAKALAGALMMAATHSEPTRANERYLAFIESARTMATTSV